MPDPMPPKAARQAWMSLLAKATDGAARAHLATLGPLPQTTWLRAPEIGSVMVRGRTGGQGTPFNLGEMTVTRCALRLSSGEVGHGYVQGRRKACAEAAALIDALMQTDRAEEIAAKVLTPLRAAQDAAKSTRARKAAATKVDFFTLQRGDT